MQVCWRARRRVSHSPGDIAHCLTTLISSTSPTRNLHTSSFFSMYYIHTLDKSWYSTGAFLYLFPARAPGLAWYLFMQLLPLIPTCTRLACVCVSVARVLFYWIFPCTSSGSRFGLTHCTPIHPAAHLKEWQMQPAWRVCSADCLLQHIMIS